MPFMSSVRRVLKSRRSRNTTYPFTDLASMNKTEVRIWVWIGTCVVLPIARMQKSSSIGPGAQVVHGAADVNGSFYPEALGAAGSLAWHAHFSL
jgi:hypothetical protein